MFQAKSYKYICPNLRGSIKGLLVTILFSKSCFSLLWYFEDHVVDESDQEREKLIFPLFAPQII